MLLPRLKIERIEKSLKIMWIGYFKNCQPTIVRLVGTVVSETFLLCIKRLDSYGAVANSGQKAGNFRGNIRYQK
jgi:hypothetical protein